MVGLSAVVIGNPKGDIVLTEIYDYQCPHAKAMAPVIDKFMTQHPDVSVKLLPIVTLGEPSLVKATFALSRAIYHDDFYYVHQLLLIDSEQLSYADYQQLERLKNSSSVSNEMHTNKVKVLLDEGHTMLSNNHVNATPVFIFSSLSHAKLMPIELSGEQSLTMLNRAYTTIREEQSNAKKGTLIHH